MSVRWVRVLMGLGLLLAAGASRAAVTVDVVVGPDPARADEQLEMWITVANDGPFDLTDVTVLMDVPTDLKGLFNVTFAGTCPGSACEAGEQATFLLPTLDAGEAVTYWIPARVHSAAVDATAIVFDVEVIDDASQVAIGSGGVMVETPRELELSVTQDVDPLVPLEQVTYTLRWGLVDTSAGKTGVSLRFEIPSGAGFVDASGGALPAGGIVEWTLGDVGPGDRGEESVRLAVDAGVDLGTAFVAEGRLFDGSDEVRSRVVSRVAPDDTLELWVAASPDPARPGEIIDFEVVVGNDGAFDRTDTTLTLEYSEGLLPVFNANNDGTCGGSACEPTEDHTFLLDTRRPDRGITRSVPLRAATVADGTVVTMQSRVTDSTGAVGRSATAFTVSEARELELELTQTRDAVAPDETIDFTLSWGLIDTSTGVSGATLAFRPPAGTTVERTTGTPTEIDGETVWTLDDLDPGDQGEQTVRVRVGAGVAQGTAIRALARLEAADAAPLRVRQLSRVEPRSPLEVDVIVSPDAARPGEVLDVEITVTNAGEFERTGIEVLLEAPDHLASFFNANFDGACGGSACEPRERAQLDLDILPPGEGRTFAIPIRVDPSVLAGTTIDLEVEVRSDDEVIEAAAGFTVDSRRRLDLALIESDEPVPATGQLTYTLVWASRFDGGGISDAILELTLPDEVTLVSASNNGVLSSNVVTWALGNHDPGTGGSRTVVVVVDGGLPDGALLRAHARLIDGGTGEEVRFSETTRLAGVRPFDVSFDVGPTHAIQNGELPALLTIRNDSGFERTDVTLRVETPEDLKSLFNVDFDGACGGSACEARENATFTIPSLLAGETVAFDLPYEVADAAISGTVINFDAYATDSTGYFSHDGDAAMVGFQFDPAGPKPAIGAGAVPDGTNGEALEITFISDDTLLLTWGESCLAGDGDYAIYSGMIGNYGLYSPLACSTGGAEGAVVIAPALDTFYLVVPVNGSREGSYGRGAGGAQRAQGAGACLPQQIADTCDP